MRKVFRIYDDDDNGLISQENLIRCGKDLDESPPLEKAEAAEMIRMGDKERKGGVNNVDFMHLMKELGLIGDKDKSK